MTSTRRRRGGRRWQIRVTRDVALFSTALGLLAYEVTFGGGRPTVLTVCVSLLLAPGVLRYDERRRQNNGDDEDDR